MLFLMNIFLQLEYVYIVIFLFLCIIIVLVIPFVTYIFSEKVRKLEKMSAYECGFEPFEDARHIFEIRFFIVALLFVIFDLELLYIFP